MYIHEINVNHGFSRSTQTKTKEVGVARSHDVAANAKRSLGEVAVNKESGRRKMAVAVVVAMNVNHHGDDHHKREDHKWIKHHGGQDHKGANHDHGHDHGHDHKR